MNLISDFIRHYLLAVQFFTRGPKGLVPDGEPDGARLGLLALHFDGSGDHELAWR